MLKAVIFDMDGVLIDSEPVYLMELMDFFEIHLDSSILDDLYRRLFRLVGCPNQDYNKIMYECLCESGVQETIAQKKIQELSGMYEKEDTEQLDYRTILNPHVLNILPKLKQMGLKIAIASSSPEDNIKEVVDTCKLTAYIDEITSGLDFKESKPNPEIYLSTMKKLDVSEKEVIAVEDSTYGIQACNNAGIPVIAKRDMRYGFDQSTADYLVDDLLEVYYIIRRASRI